MREKTCPSIMGMDYMNALVNDEPAYLVAVMSRRAQKTV